MRSRSAALLVLLISLLLLSTVLAQPGNPGHGRREGPREREHHQIHENEWRNLSENARARGLARAEEAKLFARFTYANGTASGRFVGFGLAPSTGVLRDYAVNTSNGTVTFFTSVTPTPFAGGTDPVVRGARLRLDDGNATLMAHNNPTGLFQYRGENLTVTFTAPSNATLTPDNRSVTISLGSAHGHVVLNGANGTLNVTGSTITATFSGRGGVLFAAHPSASDGGAMVANLHALRDAVASERLGGMLAVVHADGAPVTDETYLGVSMRAKNVGRDRVNVTVSSDEPRGRAVVLLLDRGVVNAANGTLNVTLDGRALPAVANASAVLHANLGAAASYHANVTPQGVQVLVNVPSFSDHEIGVSVQPSTGGPAATTPVGTTSPAATSPATTSPAATSPAATSPAATTPGGSASGGGDEDNDTPGPGVLLVAPAVALAALAVGRRRG